MRYNIKAIETEYAGYKFRSRLEARWAVFFNAMGVKWYYEHEGYELSSGWYLPDFWLPEMKIHFEVKPDGVCEHAKSFRDTVGAIVVSNGMPGEGLECYCFDLCDSNGGTSEWNVAWGENHERLLCLYTKTRNDRSFYTTEWEPAERLINGETPKPSFRLRDAFNLAKQARFDKRQTKLKSKTEHIPSVDMTNAKWKVGSTVSYADGITLTATDNENWRLERLRKAVAYLRENYPNGVKQVKELVDHEGNLTCIWKQEHDCDNWHCGVRYAWVEVGEMYENVTDQYASR